MSAALLPTQLKTFRHGVHPPENKGATQGESVARMPFVDQYVVPLSQHIGAPAKPVVSVGDRVARGQLIAQPGHYVSSAVHAPATGVVTGLEPRPHPSGKLMDAVIIKTDPYSDQRILTQPPQPNPEDLADLVQQAGIVGLGGAAFPSHVKLSVPEGKKVEFVIVNGCECEPYLTCDHRLMLESADKVVAGLQIIMKQVGAERGYIGVENNKRDAAEILAEHTAHMDNLQVVPLQVKYPQGAEKMLIDAVLQREVPSGGLPLDLEIVSYNVGSAAAIAELLQTGNPLVERIVTVTGPAVSRPGNLVVPIGTPIREVLDYCGLKSNELKQLIMGGPMMGMAQKDLNAPVVKGTSGLLALTSAEMTEKREAPCIRCGRCLDACPMFLNPSRLSFLARSDRAESLKEGHMMDCFECGACSFVCPSHIPLVQLMRLGKAIVKQRGPS